MNTAADSSVERARMALMHAPPDVDPPAALWPRIETSHVRRLRRRRRTRYFGAALATVFVAASAIFLSPQLANRPRDVDWQARAQALELELRTLAQRNGPARDAELGDARVELDSVDHALQAAYDRDAGNAEVAPLWKRRSELLRVMITQREQQLALTRI